ncbi:hypothetical protein [Chryseobacterium vrystaatense]|uniref:Uncharacterized protein n=1 Tax=Chryseobacterium vrystaatense TaxID=307480 RepID=A0ABR4UMP3_9FLAO|nr:hypothetical protein [Chryseobacterium vrystaatense]KFF26263.1 hypothetical protein IW16_10355 [Chryseobacterium vrystaatense]
MLFYSVSFGAKPLDVQVQEIKEDKKSGFVHRANAANFYNQQSNIPDDAVLNNLQDYTKVLKEQIALKDGNKKLNSGR